MNNFITGGIIMKKKFLSIVTVALLATTFAGCGNNQKNATTENTSENVGSVIPDANDNAAVVEQDTDDDNDQNTENMISLSDLEQGKCMITNEQDGVSIVYNEGTYIMNTYYYFENNILKNIENARAYKTKEAAQKAYDSLKNDESVKKEYASIDIEENMVYMLSAQSKVDSLKSLNQQQLYDKLKSENPNAITNENTNTESSNSNNNTDSQNAK